MLLKQSIILAAACAAALSTFACDEPTDVDASESLACAEPSLPLAPPPGVSLEASVDDISFREPGPPSAIYVTKWGGLDIRRAGFKSIVDSCTKYGDPKLTCTLSWYDPDTSVDGNQVVGLGCSMEASAALLACYSGMFKQNGGKNI